MRARRRPEGAAPASAPGNYSSFRAVSPGGPGGPGSALQKLSVSFLPAPAVPARSLICIFVNVFIRADGAADERGSNPVMSRWGEVRAGWARARFVTPAGGAARKIVGKTLILMIMQTRGGERGHVMRFDDFDSFSSFLSDLMSCWRFLLFLVETDYNLWLTWQSNGGFFCWKSITYINVR